MWSSENAVAKEGEYQGFAKLNKASELKPTCMQFGA
jgi:hypothetical protein